MTHENAQLKPRILISSGTGYGAALVLVRPDQHVAWRGDRVEDPDVLLARVTGGKEAM
ncbi:hypothetical protein Acor_73990 [Acrocarpospora corrugata]|uniref:Uncharacterized protein n=1 Tax=Acrocarpospora corrugata TaxID=35763 RepID=A0A5M3WE29_9ACTN|nr:hypothetical protein Acor_73990 [Acrocarpospora corrugata]